ncbi:hypothetical protein GGX14DRAFT_602251, partial [Mycena pura]
MTSYPLPVFAQASQDNALSNLCGLALPSSGPGRATFNSNPNLTHPFPADASSSSATPSAPSMDSSAGSLSLSADSFPGSPSLPLGQNGPVAGNDATPTVLTASHAPAEDSDVGGINSSVKIALALLAQSQAPPTARSRASQKKPYQRKTRAKASAQITPMMDSLKMTPTPPPPHGPVGPMTGVHAGSVHAPLNPYAQMQHPQAAQQPGPSMNYGQPNHVPYAAMHGNPGYHQYPRMPPQQQLPPSALYERAMIAQYVAAQQQQQQQQNGNHHQRQALPTQYGPGMPSQSQTPPFGGYVLNPQQQFRSEPIQFQTLPFGYAPNVQQQQMAYAQEQQISHPQEQQPLPAMRYQSSVPAREQAYAQSQQTPYPELQQPLPAMQYQPAREQAAQPRAAQHKPLLLPLPADGIPDPDHRPQLPASASAALQHGGVYAFGLTVGPENMPLVHSSGARYRPRLLTGAELASVRRAEGESFWGNELYDYFTLQPWVLRITEEVPGSGRGQHKPLLLPLPADGIPDPNNRPLLPDDAVVRLCALQHGGVYAHGLTAGPENMPLVRDSGARYRSRLLTGAGLANVRRAEGESFWGNELYDYVTLQPWVLRITEEIPGSGLGATDAEPWTLQTTNI